MDRNCRECVYISVDAGHIGSIAGRCDYPVPEWLRISANPYVSGYEAQGCPMFRDKVAVAAETIPAPTQGE